MGAFTGGNDLSLYERFAADWWNKDKPAFRSLQGITKFRLKLIERWFGDVRGKVLIDLGCGGGLISVPLSWQGAKVFGIDLSPSSVAIAQSKASSDAVFLRGDLLQSGLPSSSADIVLLADVLDHIPNYEDAFIETARLLKPGGRLFVSTLNRNFIAWFLAILIGESIGLVPKGTHDIRLFIKPVELEQAAARAGLRFVTWQGERPSLWPTVKSWAIHFTETQSLAIAYCGLFEKVN